MSEAKTEKKAIGDGKKATDEGATEPKVSKPTSMQAKWGLHAGQTFTSVPNLLLENAVRMEISPPELLLLIHIIKHWWKEENKIFPSNSLLADLMGRDSRTVQRLISKLESNEAPIRNGWSKQAGYIKRVPRHIGGSGGQTSNEIDLTNLVKCLDAIGKELEREKKDVDKRYNRRKPRRVTGRA